MMATMMPIPTNVDTGMSNSSSSPTPFLTDDQIQTFLRDGVVVIDDILTPQQVSDAKEALSASLERLAGVDTDNLLETGHGLCQLSSTNGSGGVLDVFYEDWKMELAAHPRLFQATTELWKAAYCHEGETLQQVVGERDDQTFRWHPYGAFDCDKGYCYIDRIGYRIPTKLAEQLGAQFASNKNTTKDNGASTTSTNSTTSKKKSKAKAIQRSLTPHLDCCPDNLFPTAKVNDDEDGTTTNNKKWRPIQCFVSLSDTLEPQRGGFECAKGFHRDFHTWAANRPPTVQTTRKKQQVKGKGVVVTEQQVSFPAPCLGEYTHIRPVEDKDVMDRIEHIPVRAGSAVFWDNRLPHANSYRHDGDEPRCVVYCSFLPDVAINRDYAQRQLWKWQHGVLPNDQWTQEDRHEAQSTNAEDGVQHVGQATWLTPLAWRLLYLEKWQ